VKDIISGKIDFDEFDRLEKEREFMELTKEEIK
jgi:hypothetical protein